MKKKLLAIVLLLLITSAFTSKNLINKIAINIDKSAVTWIGKKITGKHTGTLNFLEGYLEMDGNTITGGMFTIDMTSLEVIDLKADKGKEKLEKYLSAQYFFNVEKYAVATFEITEAINNGNDYKLTGNLTIKGHTENIKIYLTKNKNTATTSFMVDRTKFGVTYKSGSFIDDLKNRAINDQFELIVNLVF